MLRRSASLTFSPTTVRARMEPAGTRHHALGAVP